MTTLVVVAQPLAVKLAIAASAAFDGDNPAPTVGAATVGKLAVLE